MEATTPNHPVPSRSGVPVSERTRVPRASDCFTSAMDLFRASYPRPPQVTGTHPTAPPGTSRPALVPQAGTGAPTHGSTVPGITLPTAASPTATLRHQQRLRAMMQRNQRQQQTRRMTTALTGMGVAAPSLSGMMFQSPPTTTSESPSHLYQWIPNVIRSWLSPPSTTDERGSALASSIYNSPVWWQEMDEDVAWTLTQWLEQCMGVPSHVLTDSTGLRTLVRRQLGWIQHTPEWMQLIGLLLAKRWRHRSSGGMPVRVPCSSVEIPMSTDSVVPPLPPPSEDHPLDSDVSVALTTSTTPPDPTSRTMDVDSEPPTTTTIDENPTVVPPPSKVSKSTRTKKSVVAPTPPNQTNKKRKSTTVSEDIVEENTHNNTPKKKKKTQTIVIIPSKPKKPAVAIPPAAVKRPRRTNNITAVTTTTTIPIPSEEKEEEEEVPTQPCMSQDEGRALLRSCLTLPDYEGDDGFPASSPHHCQIL